MLDAATFCRGLVEEGTVYSFLADHRNELFLEGLSDRDAIRQLRTRIDGKVACGLALDDPGFDFTVLTYWRTRLRQSERPQRIFDAVRAVVEATGVLKTKHRRALDSSILDDAVATQDTVTQLIAAMRRVRRSVPQAARVPLTTASDEGAKPVIEWSDQSARNALFDRACERRLRGPRRGREHSDRSRGERRRRPAGSHCGPGRRARCERRHLAYRQQGRQGPGHLRQSMWRPVTVTSRRPCAQTASRRISPPSPTPGSSPPQSSPQPTTPTGRSASLSCRRARRSRGPGRFGLWLRCRAQRS